jgi:hypothetical protein
MKTYQQRPEIYKYGEIAVRGFEKESWKGYESIRNEIVKMINETSKLVLGIDCYPGVDTEEIIDNLRRTVDFIMIVRTEELFYSKDRLTTLISRGLTEERAYENMLRKNFLDLMDLKKMTGMKKKINAEKEGVILVIGPGAALCANLDIHIYADITRDSVKKRFLRKKPRLVVDSNSDDFKRYKRAFAIEWEMADRYKADVLNRIDYLLDTNEEGSPRMITRKAFMAGLSQVVRMPTKSIEIIYDDFNDGAINLDSSIYMNCISKENSQYLHYGEIRVEIPCQNVILFRPVELLGDRVFRRFGAEFPVKLDRELLKEERHRIVKEECFNTEDIINIIKVEKGEAVTIESPDNSFEPFSVKKLDSIIVPAAVGRYRLRNHGIGEGESVSVIRAYPDI